METFLTDKNGLSVGDFEKLLLAFLFLIGTLAIITIFILSQFLFEVGSIKGLEQICWLDSAIGLLFIGNKGVDIIKEIKQPNINS